MTTLTKEEAKASIDEKIKLARQLIKECEGLADSSGVMFNYSFGRMRDSYIPTGCKEDEYGDDREYGEDGWQRSSC